MIGKVRWCPVCEGKIMPDIHGGPSPHTCPTVEPSLPDTESPTIQQERMQCPACVKLVLENAVLRAKLAALEEP